MKKHERRRMPYYFLSCTYNILRGKITLEKKPNAWKMLCYQIYYLSFRKSPFPHTFVKFRLLILTTVVLINASDLNTLMESSSRNYLLIFNLGLRQIVHSCSCVSIVLLLPSVMSTPFMCL